MCFRIALIMFVLGFAGDAFAFCPADERGFFPNFTGIASIDSFLWSSWSALVILFSLVLSVSLLFILKGRLQTIVPLGLFCLAVGLFVLRSMITC